MTIQFTLKGPEAAELMKPVNGQGGFQTFFRKLQGKLVSPANTIDLSDAELGRIVRHITYRPGGFEDRLNTIFGRSIREAIT